MFGLRLSLSQFPVNRMNGLLRLGAKSIHGRQQAPSRLPVSALVVIHTLRSMYLLIERASLI